MNLSRSTCRFRDASRLPALPVRFGSQALSGLARVVLHLKKDRLVRMNICHRMEAGNADEYGVSSLAEARGKMHVATLDSPR